MAIEAEERFKDADMFWRNPPRWCLKGGWPDFMVYDEDGLAGVVECKPSIERKGCLTVNQTIAMWLLDRAGIRCCVSDGVLLHEFDLHKHGARKIVKAIETGSHWENSDLFLQGVPTGLLEEWQGATH